MGEGILEKRVAHKNNNNNNKNYMIPLNNNKNAAAQSTTNTKTNKINPKKKMKKSKFSLTDNFLSIDGIGLGKIAIIPARCCQINADRIFVTVFHVPHFVGHFVIFPCVCPLYIYWTNFK